jgi:hypothetical protein
VSTLYLDQLIGLQNGAPKELIAGQEFVAFPHRKRDGKRRA